MSKVTTKKKKRRKMSRGGGKKYFTKDHEDAIVQYALSDDRAVKTKLYVELINPAFNEMVDKIVYTYKFTNLPNIDDLKGTHLYFQINRAANKKTLYEHIFIHTCI